MDIVAIIVAAGRGRRAGEGLPKQYRRLGERTVLGHTLEAFLSHDAIAAVICAIHRDDRVLYEDVVHSLEPRLADKLLSPAEGGESRQDSVRAALEAVTSVDMMSDRLCLVHDAARPFVSRALVDRAISAGASHGAAVPGTAVTDTIRRIGHNDDVYETLDRAQLRAIQTPQAFRLGPLLAAHRAAADAETSSLTDDGSVMEWFGVPVHVFEGDPLNIKLTDPADFRDAERRLSGSRATMTTRIGTGFDVHAFAEGDHIWLGGVSIPHARGILAHSDGDVVLHALTDAILGAIADGDIGSHFPPSDPAWRGASSERFLAFAVERVRARGGRVDHLDATVMCETPRVGPHRDAMRQRIAAIAGVAEGSVSIKATTTERLGFTGRSEGIAAQAAATVRLPEAQ